MTEQNDENNNTLWDYTLTPAEALDRYTQGVKFLNDFYRTVFSVDEYFPIVKDGLEEHLNLMQFVINYANSNPFIDSRYKTNIVLWATQALFWIGYLEGKSADVKLPKAFYDALQGD